MIPYTIVERVADQLGYHCGYCGSDDTAKAKGMWSHSMMAIDYQTLIDRGWRRSGKYCYKPIMNETCCPQYPIRCKALDYKISKSKKKVLKKMRQFLMSEGDEEILKWREKNLCQRTEKREVKVEAPVEPSEPKTNSVEHRYASPSQTQQTLPEKGSIKKGSGPDPNKPLCKKAKVLRQEKRGNKGTKLQAGDGPSSSKQKVQLESLEQQIPHLNPSAEFKRKLEIRMVHADIEDKDFLKTKDESHAVYKKYQQAIHKDTADECTEKQWQRFLVDCPLNHDKTGPGPGFGNYHQQYVLDGKIIAVGVVDILPNSLSSVYLYYDPDYGFLSLGIYTALSEIAYTQNLHDQFNQLQYYYMGFYIHSCPKMNYKRGYPRSELLCPETYQWVPIDNCIPALDKSEYSRLNVTNGGSPTAQDPDRGDDFDLNEMGVIYRRNLLVYYRYVRWKYIAIKFPEQNPSRINVERAEKQQEEMDKEKVELKEYVSLVGTDCARRMFLYRPYYGED